jgi:cytochrome P450
MLTRYILRRNMSAYRNKTIIRTCPTVRKITDGVSNPSENNKLISELVKTKEINSELSLHSKPTIALTEISYCNLTLEKTNCQNIFTEIIQEGLKTNKQFESALPNFHDVTIQKQLKNIPIAVGESLERITKLVSQGAQLKTTLQKEIERIKKLIESKISFIESGSNNYLEKVQAVELLGNISNQYFALEQALEPTKTITSSPIPRWKDDRLRLEQQIICKEKDVKQALIKLLANLKDMADINFLVPNQCFISYAWSSNEAAHEYWIQPFLINLREHLREAGVNATLDIKDSPAGGNIYQYMDTVKTADCVVLVGTESLFQKHTVGASAVCNELILINKKRAQNKGNTLPILLSGTFDNALPPYLLMYTCITDWRDNSYINNLKAILASIYNIGPDNTEYNALWTEFNHKYPVLMSGISEENVNQQISKEQQLKSQEKELSSQQATQLFENINAKSKNLSEVNVSHNQNPWILPNQNKNFVKRCAYISELNDKFSIPISLNSATCLTLSAYGKGGVGKTQLAINFIHNPPQLYKCRCWFAAGNEEVLINQYRFIYKEKIDSHDTEVDNLIAKVIEWFEKNPGWLVVYDNVDDFSQIQKYMPKKGGHILITSRHEDLSLSNTMKIYEMELSEAKQLVSSIVASRINKNMYDLKFNDKKLTTLINALGSLPLAVSQAAAYIVKNLIDIDDPVAEYVEQYQQAKEDFLNDITFIELHSAYSAPVAITWNITFAYLKNKGKTLEILIYCSYLEPDNILKDMLYFCLNTQDNSYNKYDYSKDIGELYAYDMLTASYDYTKIHRLVQEVLRIQYQQEEKKLLITLIDSFHKWYDLYANDYGKMINLSTHISFIVNTICLTNKEYEDVYNRITTLLHCIHVSIFGKDESANLEYSADGVWAGTIKPSLIMMKHFSDRDWFCKKIIDNLTSIFHKSLSWQELTRINLCFSKFTRDDVQIMIKSIKNALNWLEKQNRFENKTETQIIAEVFLAQLNISEKKYTECKSVFEKAEIYLAARYGNKNQFMAILYYDLGIVNREAGCYEDSVMQFRKASAIFQEYAPKHPISLSTKLELSISLNKLNKIKESKELYYHSFDVLETIYKPFVQNPTKFIKALHILKLKDYQTGINFCHKLSQTHYIEDIINILNSFEDLKKDSNNKFLKDTIVKLYKYLPINFSLITGLRYPNLPRLTGGLLGRMRFSQEVNLFEDIKYIAKAAISHPRGMSYFWMGNTVVLLVTRPSDIKQILSYNHDKITRKKPLQVFAQLLGGNDNILLALGDKVRIYRNYLRKHLYTDDALKRIFPQMQRILADKLNEIMNSNINLKNFFNEITINIFSQCYLGTKNIPNDAAYALSCCISECFKESIIVKPLINFPNDKFVSRLTEKLKQAFKTNIIDPNSSSILNSTNLIKDVLIESCGNEVINFIDINMVYSKACTLLIAGHETTSVTFQFIIKNLSAHKEVLLKLQEELKKNLLGKEITWEILKNLHYLRAIIKETLRLYPPSIFIPRGVEKSFDIIDIGVDIDDMNNKQYNNLKDDPKRGCSKDITVYNGDIILISPYITQRLESLWPAATKFYPERHFNSKGEVSEFDFNPFSGNGAYTTFGFGERSCIGWRFAIQELTLCLATIYLNYEVELNDARPIEEKDLEWVGTLHLCKSIEARFKLLETTQNAYKNDNTQGDPIIFSYKSNHSRAMNKSYHSITRSEFINDEPLDETQNKLAKKRGIDAE